ncbi:serine/threonine-protein kinase gcn2 [Pseudomassariella vexata]|uniref:non-specific serine/threonine protein kinase n=1 Tax=Pseudomassariella vexata TaxID=1141098 RepID=A0A1Y2EI79_9PEZI|nr:serine/threonine-protein kinase gcn2 [Pseudomassariella vexata]ORY71147.1 serine/threonine-protein kinase gcn2 [Pseudomassariella vexata]
MPPWKSPGPLKAPLQHTRSNDESSYFGLNKPTSSEAISKTQYTDIQQEEIMVLQAIYGDDFHEHKAANTAWQRSEPSFDIRIKSLPDEDLSITLGVVFTATYPKSAPLLSLKDDGNLGESTLFKVKKFIETKPKVLAAQQDVEPMIHELALGIQEILDAAAQAKAQGLVLPSLAEEQALHEAELARQVEQQQAETERKKMEATEEEERLMQNMIQEELKRQRTKEKESRKKTKQQTMAKQYLEDSQESEVSKVFFDQPCRITDSAGNDLFFNTVVGKTEYRQGLVATTFTVRPILMNSQDCPTLALKEFELRFDLNPSSQFKKQLVSLETKLNSVKKLAHRNILELLDFRIDRDTRDNEASPDRIVRVLTPLADKGPLDELLDLTGQIAIGKVRSWTTDLLSALGYLHSQGLIHEDIHPGNILLFREGSGHVVPKLADASYQRELHAICRKSRTISSLNSARSAYWLPPEVANNSGPVNQKTDIWDFGVVFLQMIFGLDVFEKYQSPAALMETLSLSSSLQELVAKFFKADASRRPRALDLRSSEFLATDAPVLAEDSFDTLSPSHSMSSLLHTFRRRLDSTTLASSYSRFRNEFYEEGRLGKGGFGEVVKVRKKIDGQTYAIKKITQRASKSLTTILKEVLTLSQLSHPAIVRYYDAWTERVSDVSDTDGETSTEGIITEESETGSEGIVQFGTSTGGLDFMSSANAGIEFGYEESDDDDDDDDEEEEEEEEDDDEEEDEDDENESEDEEGGSSLSIDSVVRQQLPAAPKRLRGHTQSSFRNVLYILMEYCEKRTLRDLILQNLYENTDEIWRLFREILEGLVHIHGLNNVVHRDLKPENIFISRGTDGVAHAKIGDFGLATSGYITTVNGVPAPPESNELSNVGTATYLAPELEQPGSLDDARKVDMYALGIIFFEMSYKPMLGHERFNVLKDLRGKPPRLPADFKPHDKVQVDIVMSLVTHNPKDRPSSSELLRGDKLPILMESESIQRALADISDPSSPHYSKLVASMFSKRIDKSKDYAWDMSAPNPTPTELLYQGVVKDELITIFRRHGAVEANRNPLYPLSSHYTQNVVQLLDRNGGIVQLPYDLMLGHARILAKQSGSSVVTKSFTFGSIYRDRQNGSQPLMFGEVGFDIVSTDTLDLALKEAEVIKVLDEIVDAFPSLTQMCFHVGHSDLLQLIFDLCDVDLSLRKQAADILSKLNIHHWGWQKIRAELRLMGLSVTSIDELQRFDFRDLPTKAFLRLKSLFEGSRVYEKAQSTLAHLKEVITFTKRFGVHSKIYINPLSSFREDFFLGGILFQCVYDKKFRDVFAAGGRYDNLIREHRPKIGSQSEQRHAVGFSLSWEKLARIPKTTGKAFLKKSEEVHNMFNAKRCDILVASFDTGMLRSAGVEILQTLWLHDIRAELARDSRSPDDLMTRNRDESYSWIIIVKQDGVLKIKTMGRKDVADVEVPTTQLISWLRAELRERDRQLTVRQTDASSTAAALEKGVIPPNPEQEVRILVGNTRSKKFNRHIVVEQAQVNAAALLQSFRYGPIAAVEASDIVLDLIDATALSDAESWRKAEQSVNMTERKYMGEIHDMLLTWRNMSETKGGSRYAFVYNFRTTKCISYDLGA